MEFSEILEKIKKENSEKIVLIKCGIFYIGTGRDAIMLNNLFGLRPICYKEKICKCAIPVELLEKYLDDLNRTGYGYIVYDYYPGKERMEQEEIAKKEDVLLLIPKNKKYIKYMLEIILKLPRVEKFSIGTEYKTVMYEMLENSMYLSKIGVENKQHIAIAIFTIELTNKSKIQVKAYDELADKCCQKLKISQIVAIEGILKTELAIEIINLQIKTDKFLLAYTFQKNTVLN